MSLWGPSPRHCARVTQLFLKKCCSGGDPLTGSRFEFWIYRSRDKRDTALLTNWRFDSLAFHHYICFIPKMFKQM